MKRQISLFLSLLLLFSPAIKAAEETHPFKISEELDHVIHEGLRALYNFEFEKAHAIFDSVEDQAQEHPMVAFGKASAHWWRISSLVLEGNEEESQPFLDSVDRCLVLAEAKIKEGDPTGEGNLVMGGALGLLGRWQATNRKFLGAYRSGKKAYSYLTDAMEKNPELLDAYMGLGIFDYYVATLPAIVRFLAFLGMGGDRFKGIEELQIAAEKSEYARTPSQLFLAQIYLEQENEPEKALKILADVRSEYPKSPFIHMMRIMALFNAKEEDQLEKSTMEFNKNLKSKLYSKDFQAQGYFAEGMVHFKKKQWDKAYVSFHNAALINNELDPWPTWAMLYKGYCLDALGKRNEAIDTYRTVLDKLRRWGSHDHAKEKIRHPFKGTDEEIAKLTL